MKVTVNGMTWTLCDDGRMWSSHTRPEDNSGLSWQIWYDPVTDQVGPSSRPDKLRPRDARWAQGLTADYLKELREAIAAKT